jgi:aryl-alcohol dehydrogenase-like predicted oxidoreductase
MAQISITRREFNIAGVLLAASGIAGGAEPIAPAGDKPDPAKILNHNSKMGYRRLGKTGLWISEISLGGHNPFEADNRKEVLTRAIELGVNFFDVGPIKECASYGEVCRTHKLRDKFYISFGSLNAPEKDKAQALANIDARLRDFGTDCLDLWRPVNPNLELAAEVFETARKAGKVRFMLYANHDPDMVRAVVERMSDVCSAIMLPYMSMTKEAENGVLAACRKKDIGAIAIKPLSAGNLRNISKNAVAHLKKVLATPNLAAAIPGVDDVEQLEQNVQASYTREVALTESELRELAAAEAEHFGRLPEEYQWLGRWREV